MAKKEKNKKEKKKKQQTNIGIGNYLEQESDKNKELKTPKQQRNIQRFVILWFYGSYGLFYLMAFIFRIYLPTIDIPFVIAEKDAVVKLNTSLAELMDLLFLGILFSINAFMAFEKNYANSANRKNRSKYYMIFAIIIINLGVVVHMTANQFHDQFKLISNDITANSEATAEAIGNLELSLYFWDETASHLLTGMGIFLLIFINIHTELNNPKTVELKSPMLMTICWLVGVGLGFGMTEGQAGAIFGVVCGVLLLYIPLRCKIRKVTLNQKTFMKATMFVCFGYLVFIGGWVWYCYSLGTAFKGVYPWIYQVTEIFPDLFA